MELDYKSLEQETFQSISDHKIMVLATCSQNRVTARNMSCVIFNNRIYFQTDKSFLKYQQILDNNQVALCADNIQVEGKAVVKGHPFDEENKEFCRLYEKNFEGSFEKYSKLPTEVVIEVEPTLITLWKYSNGMPFRDFINLKDKKAYRQTIEL
jgi:general stress protein 26